MELTEYMNNAIGNIFTDAVFSSRFNAKELRFLSKAAKSQKQAAQKRIKSEACGTAVPPFLIASAATKCNLHCAGCYARANHACADETSKNEMLSERWGQLFTEARDLGVSFIILAGGEPLTRPDVLDAAAGTPEIIYPVFTNGTLFNTDMLERFDRYRNLVPVLSIEGGQTQTDSRRGKGVFSLVKKAMGNMDSRGIFYGVSVTVTKDNLASVTDSGFVSGLKKIGCRLVFFVEYVPADGNTKPALDEQDRKAMEERLDGLKASCPGIILLSFPGDEKALGGCLAAGRGFFHINAAGNAEPCPFSPYSDTSLKTGSLKDALNSALFRKIRKSNLESQEHVGGCVLFSKKEEVESMLAGK